MPRTGVSYAPELHWAAAAAWANYPLFDFFELDGDKQSFIVAAYETNMQIDSVVAQEQTRQAAARANRKKR